MSEERDLYTLIHHFRNYPSEFEALKFKGWDAKIIPPLIFDMMRKVHGDMDVTMDKLPSLEELSPDFPDENGFRTICLGAWLFHHPVFSAKPEILPHVSDFILHRLRLLSSHVKHDQWLQDEDRSEEFVREALSACDILVDGETPEEATDRLDALSTLKRLKVLQQTNASMERMKAIRKKIAEDKAREAANVYGRD